MTDSSNHPHSAPAEPAAGPPSCDILLVEDDRSLQRSLGDFLRDCGFVIYAAASCQEAWQSIQTLRPRLCLLDLNLPDGSGLDVLRNIVAQGLPVRVIVMTAFPLQHLWPGYPSQTLAGWLTKPASPQQLLEAVQGVLGTSQQAEHGIK